MSIKSDVLSKTLGKKSLFDNEKGSEILHTKYTAGKYLICTK